MRRAEFEINDKALVEELFATCEHGTLCLVDEDEPYAVPLNFVWHDETICFHGSQEGRKMEVIAKNPKASFSVVKPLSVFHRILAIPAPLVLPHSFICLCIL